MPTQKVGIYRRSAYAEGLVRRSEAIELMYLSLRSADRDTTPVIPQPLSSSRVSGTSLSSASSASSSTSQLSQSSSPCVSVMAWGGKQGRKREASGKEGPWSGSNWGEGTGGWPSESLWGEGAKGDKGLCSSPMAWTPQFEMLHFPPMAPSMMPLPPGLSDSSGLWDEGWHKGNKEGYIEGYQDG